MGTFLLARLPLWGSEAVHGCFIHGVRPSGRPSRVPPKSIRGELKVSLDFSRVTAANFGLLSLLSAVLLL
jgi:hypothetical protein